MLVVQRAPGLTASCSEGTGPDRYTFTAKKKGQRRKNEEVTRAAYRGTPHEVGPVKRVQGGPIVVTYKGPFEKRRIAGARPVTKAPSLRQFSTPFRTLSQVLNPHPARESEFPNSRPFVQGGGRVLSPATVARLYLRRRLLVCLTFPEWRHLKSGTGAATGWPAGGLLAGVLPREGRAQLGSRARPHFGFSPVWSWRTC